MRKLIAFDDDTFDKLTQLGRDRMATIQELADEAFADVLKKHGIPIDLKDALRKSAAVSSTTCCGPMCSAASGEANSTESSGSVQCPSSRRDAPNAFHSGGRSGESTNSARVSLSCHSRVEVRFEK